MLQTQGSVFRCAGGVKKDYVDILKDNVNISPASRTFLRALQQNNDLKHTSKLFQRLPGLIVSMPRCLSY